MDGISILPFLADQKSVRNNPIYVEYSNEETTPDYQEFSSKRRGRIRGSMQWLRIGDYTGVRYNIKSADDDFEIYNIVTDPAQRNNLALQVETKLSVPLQASFVPQKDETKVSSFQSYLKSTALQMHHFNSSSPRPYDSVFIPPVTKENLVQGINWKKYKGSFPWIPQVNDLTPLNKGFVSVPIIDSTVSGINILNYFTGYISVPTDGEYTFYMSCDGKAFLRIHNIQVIDEDYAYPGNVLRSANLFLKAGLHPFKLSYYRRENNGPAFLKLDWSSSNMPRQRMQENVFFRDSEKDE